MDEIEYIEHTGTVLGVDRKNNTLTIRITDADECDGCAAAALCADLRSKQDDVTVSVADASKYKEGDEVMVRGSERLHRKAMMIATVIPCILLIAVMVIVFVLTGNQLKACISGLASMIFFFWMLWAMRNRMRHEFVFNILDSHANQEV